MPGGYIVPATGDLGELTRILKEQQRDIAEIGRPSGTQTAQAVRTLTDLVNGLLTQTSVDVSGTIHSGGRGTFDGGVTSADVKSRTLSVGYDAVYIDANNIMGKSPSSRRYKQDIRPADIDPNAFYQAEVVNYRNIEAVAQLGDAAQVEIGGIAEQFEEIGLGQFVRYDDEGRPDGIAYERLTVGLITVVQQLNERLKTLEES